MLERQHDLRQPGHARRTDQVADVRLDGADGAEALAVCVAAEGVGDALNLDGVAELRARPVRLDVRDGQRVNTRVLPRGGDQFGLRVRAWRGQPVRAPAVLVDRAALDDRVDVIAVLLRAAQEFEQDDASALAPPRPSAAASNAFERPSGATMPVELLPKRSSPKKKLTPPASAYSVSRR